MKKGFTLAEVLITLAIIGVVAALTIPSVILNTNQTEYKSALKKAVSVVNQAVSLRLATENDSPSSQISGAGVLNLIAEQMNTVTNNATANGSGVSQISANTVANGQGISSAGGAYFTTTDGMQYWMADDNAINQVLTGASCSNSAKTSAAACTAPGETWFGAKQATWASGCTNANVCYMVIDVNGDKNPNKMTTSADNPQDRFLLSISGDAGTTIAPVGPGAEIMYK